MAKKKKFSMPTAFSIILILLVLLGGLTYVLPKANFCYVMEGVEQPLCEIPNEEVLGIYEGAEGDEVFDDYRLENGEVDWATIAADAEETMIINGTGVSSATLSTILMSPILGFESAIDVAIFIMILGGLLAVVNKTGALETGIKVLVKKLKGRELLLIPILMFIFSIGGTTYGMLEETVGFYILLAATMMAAGMDPLVGSAVVLLGAGSGVLGSTINPFATGAAISSLPEYMTANQGIIILIAVALWITTYAISVGFVLRYAKKVMADKGSTFLTLREQKAAEKKFGNYASKDSESELTGSQKLTLVLFALTFVVMIIGFIPWGEFGITVFDKATAWLTGAPFGGWWFYDAALWFLIMAIVIGLVNKMGEKTLVDTFIDGADDMIGVILIIGLARGVSVLMGATYLDNFIIYNASDFLAKLPEFIFIPLNYILHIFLSVLVPSSSGLASLSTPIIAPLAHQLAYNTEVTVMTMVASNGLVNLITPTCGAIMGGLALAKVEYSTWVKWAAKVVGTIFIVNILILVIFSVIF